MYTAEVRFQTSEETEADQMLLDELTSAWRSHGQVAGREFAFAFSDNVYRTFLMLPQPDALAPHHDSQYVSFAKAQLLKAGFQSPDVRIVGEDPFSLDACACSGRDSFILYTSYTNLESCLRCGDCFGPVPLYVIPFQATCEGELHDWIMSWQSDYQSCDHLQMNCSTGEKFGLREISNHNSSLSKRGAAICDGITSATGTPTYYYLHRYRGRSRTSEEKRKCPSCSGEWKLEQQSHDKFGFKCDRCRLLSNIALSIR